jgi:hypothetical protein
MHRPVYIPLVILYRKYTGVRDNDFTTRGQAEPELVGLGVHGGDPADLGSQGRHCYLGQEWQQWQQDYCVNP